MVKKPIPISCTLQATAAADQVEEWRALCHRALAAEPLPTGARLRFPAVLASVVADLAAREAACCRFLDLDVSADGDEVVVEVTADQAEALPIIARLTGVDRG